MKELIGKIEISKLKTLQLYSLNRHKLDKFNHPIKTNYKKGLNILYYQQEDLKYITSFITKDKQSYQVKKIHPMINISPKQKN
ncbi:hypothetical protein [Candidatus Phytoplasma melaleucae]|uniref:hypothetical protein n=1 Tax=Candidatus Phytoplasma melaleucae TaxID=2982630 RepID=UPI002A4E2779|nr:hypothetical protein ['Melaleuca sp.' phytoplasma]